MGIGLVNFSRPDRVFSPAPRDPMRLRFTADLRALRRAARLVAAVGLLGAGAGCSRWEMRETPEPKAGAPVTYGSERLVRVTTDAETVVLWEARVTRDSIFGVRNDPTAGRPADEVRLARSEVRAFEELRFAGRDTLTALGAIVVAAGLVLASIIGGGMD